MNGPELAFERLVGSVSVSATKPSCQYLLTKQTQLREPFNNSARQQRAALDEWREEKKALQESLDHLRLDLAELNTRLPRDIVEVDRADKIQGSAGQFIRA